MRLTFTDFFIQEYSGLFFSFLLVNMISFLDFKLELYVAELITLT